MSDIPELVLEGLARRYGATTAVARMDLAVAKGELVALLGPSGCGKTTSLRMALDILRPTSGKIEILGRAPGRENSGEIGFLPEERAWFSNVLHDIGFVDVFRQINTESDQYTWWSNRGQAWANNVGWRIDYQIATPAIAQTARNVSIYKAERFSDHAPLIIDYDHTL